MLLARRLMLYFHGFGHFHPENVIDNAFLEALDIGTNDQWITDRVGIKRRRTVLPLDYIRTTKNSDVRAAQEASLYSNAETGRRAALMAIERAGIAVADVGMVVSGSCSPEVCLPAEAARIARSLGMAVPSFDLHSACSTFGAQVHFLERMGQTLPEYVLLVSPENMTRAVDFSDRATAVLFGDATSAAVVSTKVRGPASVVLSTYDANPEGCDEVTMKRTGHFGQNGAAVHKFAIKKMSALLGSIQERLHPEERNRLIYVGHQANLPMLENVCRRAGIPVDRHLFNIVDYGNQSAAGGPAVISQNWDRFKPGDTVALVLVGAGLAWASLQIQFS